MIIGLLAAPFCYGLVEGVKNKLVLDDALDVFAVHGMGGWLGTVAIGIFADETVSGGLVKASGEQFGKQLGAACGTAVYAFVVAFALIKLIQKFMVLLPPQEAIELRLDASIHGERAYKDTSNHGASAGGYARDVANPSRRPPRRSRRCKRRNREETKSHRPFETHARRVTRETRRASGRTQNDTTGAVADRERMRTIPAPRASYYRRRATQLSQATIYVFSRRAPARSRRPLRPRSVSPPARTWT